MKKLILAAATAGVLALFSGFTPAQAQTTSNDQVLFGITLFKNELITIDLATGVGTLVRPIGSTESGYGLATFDGNLYTFNPNTSSLDRLSTVDGRVLSSTPLSVTGLAGEGDLVIATTGEGFLSSAFDPTGAPTHPLYRFNVTTGVAVQLSTTNVVLDGLALDNETVQTLYALGQGDSEAADPATFETQLYTVDQTTGALTPIGPIGVPQNSPIAGLTFAPDGTLYAAIDDKLYTIDIATGVATIVDADTPDFSFSSVSGLAFANGASVLANLSSRAQVVTGDNILIQGFIITVDPNLPGIGTPTKGIIMRAIGPSLAVDALPIPGRLADPTLTLHDSNGAEIASNDNWMENTPADQTRIVNAGLAPANDLESVIVADLPEGSYTAQLQGTNGGTGIALGEIYDIEAGNGLKVANLSARAQVAPGDAALISGMIVEGSLDKRALIRGLGPSLAAMVPSPLADPLLMAYDANGTLLETNDSWMDSPEVDDIIASGLAPSDPSEAVIDRIFTPGAYTVVLTGAGTDTTGIALLEAYDRD